MVRKLTLEEFVEKSKKIHGDKYDYSLVDYNSLYSKIKIICPKHGLFLQNLNEHLQGHGCAKCGRDITSKKLILKLNKEEFLEKAIKIHNDKYDYSLVEYDNLYCKIKIICKKHGAFEQSAKQHYMGHGCPKCGRDSVADKCKLTSEDFITRAIKFHGDEYDYSLVEYKNSGSKVKIICSKHGVFEQTPSNHLRGTKCAQCIRPNIGISRRNTQSCFIEKAQKVHGNLYDYSLINYINIRTKIKIICKQHGVFEQSPNNHLKYGCKLCGNNTLMPLEEFILKANNKHNNKYCYNIVEYENNKNKIKIICPIHGEFVQGRKSHMNGQGCNKCKNRISKNHLVLFDLLKHNIFDILLKIEQTITNDKKHYFVDILLPNEKIIIEYYGNYWHCNPKKYDGNYFHKKKKMLAKDIWDYDNNRKRQLENLGYKVFIVWEGDFVKNKIEIITKLSLNIKESITK